jgi:periplasmic protein TonB
LVQREVLKSNKAPNHPGLVAFDNGNYKFLGKYMVPVQDTSRNSRRVIAFIVVLAVHALMFWGLNAGLTDFVREKLLGDITTVDIAPPKEDEAKPPPPPPKLETTPPPFVPPPDIDISIPVDDNSSAIETAVTTERPVAVVPTAPAPRAPVDIAPKIDPRRPPGTSDEYYPAAAKRAGIEGSIVVKLQVLETGRVASVEVQTSSGDERLDQGAVAYVKTWRLLPGTRDGKPIPMTWSVKVTFKLKS